MSRSQLTACHGCGGNNSGVCIYGGDTNSPPPTGNACTARAMSREKAVLESLIARDKACNWPRRAAG